MSRPMPIRKPAMRQPANNALSTGLIAAAGQVLKRESADTAIREKDLTPAEVNEISRSQGLGICWQPGNVYRIGRTAAAKSCLIQVDAQGKELAKYGSW